MDRIENQPDVKNDEETWEETLGSHQKTFPEAALVVEDLIKFLGREKVIPVLEKLEAEVEYQKHKFRNNLALPSLGTPERDRIHIMELIERAQAKIACDVGLVESAEPFDFHSVIWRLSLNGDTNEERIKSARLLIQDCQKPATLQLTDGALAMLVEMPTYIQNKSVDNPSSASD